MRSRVTNSSKMVTCEYVRKLCSFRHPSIKEQWIIIFEYRKPVLLCDKIINFTTRYSFFQLHCHFEECNRKTYRYKWHKRKNMQINKWKKKEMLCYKILMVLNGPYYRLRSAHRLKAAGNRSIIYFIVFPSYSSISLTINRWLPIITRL